MNVQFKFNLNQKVKTIFGDIGIIKAAAIDEEGRNYYIRRSVDDKWFNENELEAIEINLGGKRSENNS